ncbi:hypothetical protein GP486_001584 [Trichoglossum hirsutum]|uniref:MARVEL domain-containing protein n=1 Tax=Trichoglossum hirsutum TaxID=265104 RepID=A0A9P8LGR6_9PEZI|nr:hypothetical protein GP486_001584 [Trichoglossum hirsutum]
MAGLGYQTDYKADATYSPVNQSTEVPYGGEVSRLEARDAKLKSQVRILKICQRVASFLLSIVLAVIMALTLAKYYTTRNTTVDGQTPWPTNTVLWPTIMLFAISAIAFLLYSGIMISYCFGVAAANRASTIASFFTVIFGTMRFAAWVVAAVLYQIGARSGRDIRSWSCGGSDNLSQGLQAVVNFNVICQTNTGSFHLTYISAIIEALGVVVWIWMTRRYFSRRAMEKARKNQGAPAGF